MARFLIVLITILACFYFFFTKTDWSSYDQSQIRPLNKNQKFFDFEGTKQKAIERQRRIDNGEF